MRTLRRLYRRAMLFILDIHPPWWGRAGVWAAAAIILLIVYSESQFLDGLAARRPGVLEWVGPVAGILGLALLIASVVVGKVRRLLRFGHVDRIALAANQHCPRCEYPLSGLPSADTCPECGLDISADTAASRRELARR